MKQHTDFNTVNFYYQLARWADNELLLTLNNPSNLRSHLDIKWHLYDTTPQSEVSWAIEQKIIGDDNE